MRKRAKKMENGTNSSNYVTSREAMKLLGYETQSGVNRFLQMEAKVSRKKVRGPRGKPINAYSRAQVMALRQKQGKLDLADEVPVVKPVVDVKPVQGSIPIDSEISESMSPDGAKVGGEWLTVEDAAGVLGYGSTSGARGALIRAKIPYKTMTSSRGRTDMRLYSRSDIEKFRDANPPPKGAGHRQPRSKKIDLGELNEALSGGVSSNDPVLRAIQELFAHHPRLVEVKANRMTGEIQLVLAVEARL